MTVYELTLPDTIILMILLVIIVIMFVVWPRYEEKLAGAIERSFIMGVTAMRTAWNSRTGIHTICIMAARTFDTPPLPGDMVVFVEKGGDMARYRILTSENVRSKAPDQRPHVIVTALPVK
jgi:hypothetical protein